MKKIYLLLALPAILAFNQTKAQFNSVKDCGAKGVGHSIFFINPDTGFVAGEDNTGVIQKTMDGGNTWSRVYASPTNFEWVNDVFFANSTNGFAVGVNGTIIRTTDGGGNWSSQTIPNVSIFASVFFPTSLIGYVTGDGSSRGPIYKTTDGGNNWVAQTSNATGALRSIFFVDANTGYAFGNEDILKTSDGGTTWVRSNNNFPANDTSYLGHREMYCTDANTCYIPGAPIQKTIDGGITWNPLSQPSISPPYFNFTTAIHFTNSQTGFAVGAKIDTSNFTLVGGTIIKTVDAGLSWNEINTPANNDTLIKRPLSSIRFVNSQTGYTSSQKGKVLKTMNAGGSGVGIGSLNHKANKIHIYPNPFSATAILEADDFFKDASLTVYNSLGQIVRKIKNISGKTITLSRDNLPRGLYFLRLTENDKTFETEKLVITDN
jgi:photosystem II stability/assembly factor-like uncharacterized protein